MSHVDAVYRRKHYLGRGHPMADQNGNEKYVRLVTEIPPEVAAYLEDALRELLGVNASAFSRANMMRAALVAYLDELDPRDDDQWKFHGKTPEEIAAMLGVVEGSAEEMRPELPNGDPDD